MEEMINEEGEEFPECLCIQIKYEEAAACVFLYVS